MKIILSLAFLALFWSFSASAVTTGELRSQIEEKNKEIQQLEKEIQKFQDGIEASGATAKTLKSEILRLEREIKQLKSQISLTEKKISKKTLEIDELNGDIESTNEAIGVHKATLKESLRSLNDLEKESMLENFLKYAAISDFFSEIENTKLLNDNIKQSYNNLTFLKEKLENTKKETEAAKNELSSLKSQLLGQKMAEENGKAEKNNLLKITKSKEAEYQKLLRDREQKRAQIYAEISKIETELRRQIDYSTLPSFGKGILLLPIDGGALTQGFGKTEFAKNTDAYGNNFHNGVDFRAPQGTAVRSSEAGIIKATGNSDLICPKGSYGKWVLIEHQNKLATLYAHLSLIQVSQGQNIGKGDIIGYSGSTGYVTGPHLHFTVYDSRTVQLRQSRVCGILPYGGYLDPLNYL